MLTIFHIKFKQLIFLYIIGANFLIPKVALSSTLYPVLIRSFIPGKLVGAPIRNFHAYNDTICFLESIVPQTGPIPTDTLIYSTNGGNAWVVLANQPQKEQYLSIFRFNESNCIWRMNVKWDSIAKRYSGYTESSTDGGWSYHYVSTLDSFIASLVPYGIQNSQVIGINDSYSVFDCTSDDAGIKYDNWYITADTGRTFNRILVPQSTVGPEGTCAELFFDISCPGEWLAKVGPLGFVIVDDTKLYRTQNYGKSYNVLDIDSVKLAKVPGYPPYEIQNHYGLMNCSTIYKAISKSVKRLRSGDLSLALGYDVYDANIDSVSTINITPQCFHYDSNSVYSGTVYYISSCTLETSSEYSSRFYCLVTKRSTDSSYHHVFGIEQKLFAYDILSSKSSLYSLNDSLVFSDIWYDHKKDCLYLKGGDKNAYLSDPTQQSYSLYKISAISRQTTSVDVGLTSEAKNAVVSGIDRLDFQLSAYSNIVSISAYDVLGRSENVSSVLRISEVDNHITVRAIPTITPNVVYIRVVTNKESIIALLLSH